MTYFLPPFRISGVDPDDPPSAMWPLLELSNGGGIAKLTFLEDWSCSYIVGGFFSLVVCGFNPILARRMRLRSS